MNLFDLSGRTALVTGAGGDIGRAICGALGHAGARVLASDRAGADPALCADLATPDGPKALARAVQAAGGADILVLNAGIEGPTGPAHTATEADIDLTFAVNLRAALTLTAALVPMMAARGQGGAVILMASIAGMRGNARIGTYALTKAALAQHARNLAVEWGPQGVRANAVAPGLIDTRFAAPLLSDPIFMARRMAATPLRRAGTPDEVAGTVLWLASPAGAFVTGQTIIIDGGTLISDGS
jgi:NAD(P)-dependent dehydrogenase (short-subunit alcohol dehydrogenase family)